MSSYLYTKTPVALDKLSRDIRASSIVTAFDLDLTQVFGNQLTLVFKDVLSSGDQQTLDAIVADHDGVPLDLPTPVVKLDGPSDTDGSLIIRQKTTKTGWHFEPRSLDYWTSRAGSLYNRKFNHAPILDGDDIGDGTLRFYDVTDTVLLPTDGESPSDFQTRLSANCVKTIMDWEPMFDYDVIGAYIQMMNVPPSDNPAYMWVIIAPDIPASLGGSVPFCNGGWNLSFFKNNDIFDVDGHGVKSMVYSATYHTNKIRVLIKHGVGYQLGVQIIYKEYKA